jgi:transposase, IS5 family
MKQMAMSMTGYFDKGKKTRRERFLAEMEQVVPWARLCGLIEPHYPKGSAAGGGPPLPLERMLRIYCLQQWYDLSDPGAEEALYDSITMRQFAGVRTDADVIPDETSILNFRRLLEKHRLTERLFAEVNAHLAERGQFVGKGTIVDATIIDAPSSTKNEKKQRDPEMHQTRKGKQWCVSRTQAADLWCGTEDGSRPSGAGLQEQASNHPVLLRSKGAVVSDRAKVIPSGVAGTY